MTTSAHNDLLERDGQLAALRHALAAAQTGQGSCVLLSGEAGTGKTSVIRWFTRDLDGSVRVLAGACDDLRATRPFGALRDAVRQVQGPLACIQVASELDAVLDSLASGLSGPECTVMVIEDAHWADEATIDVLHHLIRRLDGWPLLLIITFRPEDARDRPALRRMLAAATGRSARRLVVEPLTLAAVDRLASDTAHRGSDLLALTGGNPFYLTEVLAGPSEYVPASVRDVVLGRVASLDADSIDAVEQLSVIPMSIDATLAEGLLGGELNRTAAAERLGILTLDSAHGRHSVAFRHELARRAVESELPAMRRRQLNRHVLEAMLVATERPELARLVHHAVEAGATEQIVAFAPQAGREAAKAGAHGEALLHFELALSFRGSLPPEEITELLYAYSYQLYLAGRYSQAVVIGIETIERLATAGNSTELVHALVRLSRSQFLDGNTAAAIESADRAVEASKNTASADAVAAAVTEQSIIGVLSGIDHQEAVRRLSSAKEVSVEASRADLTALCLNYLGVTYCDVGDARGLGVLYESLEAARAAKAHESMARAYINLGQMLYRLERWVELADVLDAGIEYAHEHALWGNALDLELHRALLFVRQSRWDDAREIYEKAHSELVECGRQYLYLLMFEALFAVRSGYPDAEERLRLARAEADRQDSPVGLAYTALATLEWGWLHDEPELARQTWAALEASPHRGPLFRQAERLRHRLDGQAPDDWRENAARWHDLGAPYDEALELASSGDITSMTEAYRIMIDLGAEPAARRIRRTLREAGVTRLLPAPRASSRTNPAGLTARQLRVAELLAANRSNAEIAEELVLSVRTVHHHVSAVLAKLQVSSRHDVAARIRDLGGLV